MFLLLFWKLVEDRWHELWTGFVEPKNIVWGITLGRGGVCGVLKNCTLQNVSFNFFSRTLSLCSLLSIYDVDFIIWFLKRWYFFRKKIKPLWMSLFFLFLFLLLENFRTCFLPMFSFPRHGAYKMFTPSFDFFMIYCFAMLNKSGCNEPFFHATHQKKISLGIQQHLLEIYLFSLLVTTPLIVFYSVRSQQAMGNFQKDVLWCCKENKSQV